MPVESVTVGSVEIARVSDGVMTGPPAFFFSGIPPFPTSVRLDSSCAWEELVPGTGDQRRAHASFQRTLSMGSTLYVTRYSFFKGLPSFFCWPTGLSAYLGWEPAYCVSPESEMKKGS